MTISEWVDDNNFKFDFYGFLNIEGEIFDDFNRFFPDFPHFYDSEMHIKKLDSGYRVCLSGTMMVPLDVKIFDLTKYDCEFMIAILSISSDVNIKCEKAVKIDKMIVLGNRAIFEGAFKCDSVDSSGPSWIKGVTVNKHIITHDTETTFFGCKFPNTEVFNGIEWDKSIVFIDCNFDVVFHRPNNVKVTNCFFSVCRFKIKNNVSMKLNVKFIFNTCDLDGCVFDEPMVENKEEGSETTVMMNSSMVKNCEFNKIRYVASSDDKENNRWNDPNIYNSHFISCKFVGLIRLHTLDVVDRKHPKMFLNDCVIKDCDIIDNVVFIGPCQFEDVSKIYRFQIAKLKDFKLKVYIDGNLTNHIKKVLKYLKNEMKIDVVERIKVLIENHVTTIELCEISAFLGMCPNYADDTNNSLLADNISQLLMEEGMDEKPQ